MSFFVSNQKLPQQIWQKSFVSYHRQCVTSQGFADISISADTIRRLKNRPENPDKAFKMPKTSAFDSKKSREIHQWWDWGGDICSRTAWKAPCWLSNDVQPSKCYKTKLWFIHPSNFKQSQIWRKVSYAKVPCWSLGKGRVPRTRFEAFYPKFNCFVKVLRFHGINSL